MTGGDGPEPEPEPPAWVGSDEWVTTRVSNGSVELAAPGGRGRVRVDSDPDGVWVGWPSAGDGPERPSSVEEAYRVVAAELGVDPGRLRFRLAPEDGAGPDRRRRLPILDRLDSVEERLDRLERGGGVVTDG